MVYYTNVEMGSLICCNKQMHWSFTTMPLVNRVQIFLKSNFCSWSFWFSYIFTVLLALWILVNWCEDGWTLDILQCRPLNLSLKYFYLLFWCFNLYLRVYCRNLRNTIQYSTTQPTVWISFWNDSLTFFSKRYICVINVLCTVLTNNITVLNKFTSYRVFKFYSGFQE